MNEQKRKKLGELLEKYKIDITKEPPKPVNTFYILDRVVGSLGNFVILSGLPKVRKSTVNSFLLASLFGNEDLGFRFNFPENRAKKILYFDTEQNKHSTYKIYERACKYAGGLIEDIEVYSLRTAGAKEIIEIIEYRIITSGAPIIFIDGLLDLCDNFNSENESKALINYLKRITTQYNLLAICVIHLSKSSGQTLGHLGAMCDRYSQSTIEIFKDKEQPNNIGIRSKLMRDDLDFEDFFLTPNFEGEYRIL